MNYSHSRSISQSKNGRVKSTQEIDNGSDDSVRSRAQSEINRVARRNIGNRK